VFIWRRMVWAGHVTRIGRGGVHTRFWWESEGKRPLRIPRLRWQDNIKLDFQEMRCGRGLARDRDRWRTVVNAVMNRQVPWNEGNL
jgi:hypothetical protein